MGIVGMKTAETGMFPNPDMNNKGVVKPERIVYFWIIKGSQVLQRPSQKQNRRVMPKAKPKPRVKRIHVYQRIRIALRQGKRTYSSALIFQTILRCRWNNQASSSSKTSWSVEQR